MDISKSEDFLKIAKHRKILQVLSGGLEILNHGIINEEP